MHPLNPFVSQVWSSKNAVLGELAALTANEAAGTAVFQRFHDFNVNCIFDDVNCFFAVNGRGDEDAFLQRE